MPTSSTTTIITPKSTATSISKQLSLYSRRNFAPAFFVAERPGRTSNARMKKIVFLLPLLLALRLPAADTNDVAPVKIGTAEADKHYDQLMTVTGMVAQVTARPGITFLNLDKPHPDSPFTCVIFPAATNQFGDVKSLMGASIEVTGKIKSYHDAAEMILDHSNQLVIVSAGTNSAAK